jgi:hypothetical protein
LGSAAYGRFPFFGWLFGALCRHWQKLETAILRLIVLSKAAIRVPEYNFWLERQQYGYFPPFDARPRTSAPGHSGHWRCSAMAAVESKLFP